MQGKFFFGMALVMLFIAAAVVGILRGPGVSARTPTQEGGAFDGLCEALYLAREESLGPTSHGLVYVAVDGFVDSVCGGGVADRIAVRFEALAGPTATATARPHLHSMCQRHYHEAVLGEYEHVHEADGSVRYADCDPSDGSTPTPVPTEVARAPHLDYSLTVEEPAVTPAPVDMSLVDLEDLSNHDWVRDNEPQVYQDILNMDWVRDGITIGPEFYGLGRLFVMLGSQRRISASIALQNWFLDGLDEVEADAILAFGELSRWNEDTSLYVVGSSWFVDGVTANEVLVVRMLSELVPLNVDRTDDVARLDWLDNGVSELDASVMEQIRLLAQHLESDRLFSLLEMPFLEMTDAADLGALMSLNSLAENHPEDLDSVFGYRRVRDGIDDSETPLVGALSTEVWRGAKDYEWLLIRGIGMAEERWIELPLAGPVRLTIVRADHGYDGSMDRLEDIVRTAESIVGRPFPTAHVSVVFSPNMAGGIDHSFDGHQVSVRDVYDSVEREDAVGVMAGVVARHYWNGNAEWLDTGLSEYIAAVAERPESGEVRVRNAPCGYVRDVMGLEAIGVSTYPECERSLGERLFHDLAINLSEGDFVLGLSRLHVLVTEEGLRGDMGDVYRAFDFAPVAREGVIPRWWDRRVAYDVGRLDLSVADPVLWSINGVITDSYLSFDGIEEVTRVDGGAVPGWLSLILRYRHDYSYRDQALDLEVVQVYEDGFAYSWETLALSAPSKTTGWNVRSLVGRSPGVRWAPGRHWVYVYDRGRKVASASYYVTDDPELDIPVNDLEERSARVVSVRGFLDRDPAPGLQTEVEVVFSEPVWVSGDIGVSVLGKGTLRCRNQTAPIPRIDECPTSAERAGRKLRFFYWTGDPLAKGEMPFIAEGDRIDRFILGRGAFIRDGDRGTVYYGFGAGVFRDE